MKRLWYNLWLWLNRCPIHKSRLDADGGDVRYCVRCPGIGRWPRRL